MRVRMIKDHKAYPDGNTEQRFQKGKSYDVPETMANNWLNKAIAMEDKAIDKAPETKTKKTTAQKRARK